MQTLTKWDRVILEREYYLNNLFPDYEYEAIVKADMQKFSSCPELFPHSIHGCKQGCPACDRTELLRWWCRLWNFLRARLV